MALRLKPETRERWAKRFATQEALESTQWRPVPRAEPAPEPSSNTFDIYCKTWVDT